MIVHIIGTERPYGLENPSYQAIRLVYESAGVTCRMLSMGPEGIRRDALSGTDAGLLHVTPFHSWPSGITAGVSKRREYVSWAERRTPSCRWTQPRWKSIWYTPARQRFTALKAPSPRP